MLQNHGRKVDSSAALQARLTWTHLLSTSAAWPLLCTSCKAQMDSRLDNLKPSVLKPMHCKHKITLPMKCVLLCCFQCKLDMLTACKAIHCFHEVAQLFNAGMWLWIRVLHLQKQ